MLNIITLYDMLILYVLNMLTISHIHLCNSIYDNIYYTLGYNLQYDNI